jgi:hypothetical protein
MIYLVYLYFHKIITLYLRIKMSQSSSCILYSAEKQDELRTHSKFKNSFSTLKLKSRSQQSHYKSTGLPQLVHNPREIKPR